MTTLSGIVIKSLDSVHLVNGALFLTAFLSFLGILFPNSALSLVLAFFACVASSIVLVRDFKGTMARTRFRMFKRIDWRSWAATGVVVLVVGLYFAVLAAGVLGWGVSQDFLERAPGVLAGMTLVVTLFFQFFTKDWESRFPATVFRVSQSTITFGGAVLVILFLGWHTFSGDAAGV